jgi:phosphoribosylanthranilate isomerase
MKIKICGLKQPENIREIRELRPDYMGFIFYRKSKRYVHMNDSFENFQEIDGGIKKVAVFVNETAENISQTLNGLDFDIIQLHGSESPETVKELKSKGYQVIKAFSMKTGFDFSLLQNYEGICDYFLFDTATPQYGGSGKKFNWDLLEHYQDKTSFLLSGGISLKDAEVIKKLHHPRLAGIDVNSGFEIEPGLKDIDLLEKFIKEIRK